MPARHAPTASVSFIAANAARHPVRRKNRPARASFRRCAVSAAREGRPSPIHAWRAPRVFASSHPANAAARMIARSSRNSAPGNSRRSAASATDDQEHSRMPARHGRTGSAWLIPGNAVNRTKTDVEKARIRKDAGLFFCARSPDLACRRQGFVYHVCLNALQSRLSRPSARLATFRTFILGCGQAAHGQGRSFVMDEGGNQYGVCFSSSSSIGGAAVVHSTRCLHDRRACATGQDRRELSCRRDQAGACSHAGAGSRCLSVVRAGRHGQPDLGCPGFR